MLETQIAVSKVKLIYILATVDTTCLVFLLEAP
jgi:hypothetical protein